MAWSLLPSPTASQDLASQLHTLKTVIPDSQQRIASRQHGVRVLRSDAQYAMIYAIMSIDSLEAVATLPFVRCIDLPAYPVFEEGLVAQVVCQAMPHR